jgi:hypothetical protein
MQSKSLKSLCLVIFTSAIAFIAQAEDLGTLSGADTKDLRVLIRKIDEGEILWVKSYQLGTEAKVPSGSHNISIRCEFRHSWGNELMPGILTIEIQSGKKYSLTGSQSADGKSCIVTATENT